MMVSAPDTPYGAAFVQFCMLFARRPLNIAKLHESFDTLASLAARDHPEMVWPTTMNTGDGQTMLFTVEALLTKRWNRYANRATVPIATIKELLLRWDNASIKEVVAGWQGAGFQLRMAKRVRSELKRAHSQNVGSLVVACSWKLMRKEAVFCSSSDTDQHIEESLRALKGVTISSSNVGAGGILVLNWKSDFWLEISPDGWVISSDYFLDFGWDGDQPLVFKCFEKGFISFEQNAFSEDDAADSARENDA